MHVFLFDTIGALLLGEAEVKQFGQIFCFIQQRRQSPKRLLLSQLHQQHRSYVGHPCGIHKRTHTFVLKETQRCINIAFPKQTERGNGV